MLVGVIWGENEKNASPANLRVMRFSLVIGRRPTLPPGFPGSTIGARELNFRVRDGNGWDLPAIITDQDDEVVQPYLKGSFAKACCSLLLASELSF